MRWIYKPPGSMDSLLNSVPCILHPVLFLLDFLTLKDGTDKLSRNVRKNYHHALCRIPEEHRSPVLYVGELLDS